MACSGHDNGIQIYSSHNEGKTAAAERFIRTLKKKIYKHITAVSKYVYLNKLDTIVGKYNNIYHRPKKREPVDVKSGNYIEFMLSKTKKIRNSKLVTI